MPSKLPAILLLLISLRCTTSMPVSVYNNSQWIPFDQRYEFETLSLIDSAATCLCLCHENPVCLVTTYSGNNQTCSLFFGRIDQGQLQLMAISTKTQVYDFGNQNSPALQIFKRSNQTAYAIWNTTAGGDSTPSLPGYSVGTYWLTQTPEDALDDDPTTEYTSHGICYSDAPFSMACGINTGLYLTLSSSPFTLVGFYMGSSARYLARDPMTITIEGSNLTGAALVVGSSWSLIYNGSSGLQFNSVVGALGVLQMLSDSSRRFISYRLLITSKRDLQESVGYTEFAMIGY